MKYKTSFSLSEEALRLLKAIAEKNGISKTAVLEIIIRQKAIADLDWSEYDPEAAQQRRRAREAREKVE